MAIQEINQKIEQRINAKIISSDIDFEKMEKDEIANYDLYRLLLSPFKTLPIVLIFSFVFSFIFSIMQKFNLNKEGQSYR